MNLTTKRMLQFMTVCAGVSALTASAANQWVTDSFEAPAGSANLPINQYKMSVSGALNETTNRVWLSTEGDASILVTGESDYGPLRPMDTTKQLILKLATEGTTISRTVAETPSFATSSVYVDSLIQFIPSEDTPTIEAGVKVALYVNVNTNLVIYHRTLDDQNASIYTNTVIPGLVSTNWNRLTIQMGTPSGVGEQACKIFLNGEGITNVNAYTDAAGKGGAWFLTASTGVTLNSVDFQGTGFVDELTVSDIEPNFFVPSTGILLTLKFTDYVSMIDVTTNGVPVADLVQVPNDTAVLITAKPWYEIYDVGTLFTGSATNASVGAMATAISGMVSSAQSATNEFKARLYSDTGSISTGLGGSYPADKVAEWATTHAGSAYPLTSDMLDDYLLNVDNGTNAKLKINSITLDDGTELATITVGATSGLVDLHATALNGTLVVSTTDDLATPFAEILTFVITLETAPEVTITVPYDAAAVKFIKAVVK